MRLAALTLSAFCLFAFGCSAGPGPDETVEGEDELRGGAASTKAVVKGNSEFATDLYQELKDGDDNVFFSPYSISSALAMTYAGANGGTATAMREALRLPSGNVHAAFKNIAAQLKSRNATDYRGRAGFQLSVANSLWGEKTQRFDSGFVSVVGDNYGAGLELADFLHKADAERVRINTWVSDQTNAKIKDLLPPNILKADTKLVLVNAIYFKAEWDSPFQTDNTEREPFAPLAGGSVNVDMMSQTRSMNHAATEAYDAVALPYAGNEVELVAIAPKAGTFRSFERTFDAAKLTQITGAMEPKRVALSLPKFKIEGASVKLKDKLESLGMGVAFTDSADFRGISGSRDTKIADVVHKAFIALDEKGTEAAAATAVINVARGMAPRQTITARFDRPFLFAIRDVPTGTVLFMGRVAKP